MFWQQVNENVKYLLQKPVSSRPTQTIGSDLTELLTGHKGIWIFAIKGWILVMCSTFLNGDQNCEKFLFSHWKFKRNRMLKTPEQTMCNGGVAYLFLWRATVQEVQMLRWDYGCLFAWEVVWTSDTAGNGVFFLLLKGGSRSMIFPSFEAFSLRNRAADGASIYGGNNNKVPFKLGAWWLKNFRLCFEWKKVSLNQP